MTALIIALLAFLVGVGVGVGVMTLWLMGYFE